MAENTPRAASSNAGAITTSTNCFATACAAAASTARLKAMMPPNAEVGSVLNALAYASAALPPTATPHGFACLMITQAGSSKLRTQSHAASASAMLLYDSSLPCSCV